MGYKDVFATLWMTVLIELGVNIPIVPSAPTQNITMYYKPVKFYDKFYNKRNKKRKSGFA